MKIQLPAIMQPPALKKDHTATMKFSTRELSADEVSLIWNMTHVQSEGWLVFSPNELQEDDLPNQDAEVSQKTPSQRLRAVLYVYHQQLGGDSFDQFYRDKMEEVIEHFKTKLD